MPAATQGDSEKITARSRFLPLLDPLPVPNRFTSQKIPPPEKPWGDVTDPEINEILIALENKGGSNGKE